MKANELMVGDWVYAIDANGEKHPCRANNLEYDYTNKRGDFCVDFYGTGYEAEWPDVAFNVEPIPLTTEILEKNSDGGFFFHDCPIIGYNGKRSTCHIGRASLYVEWERISMKPYIEIHGLGDTFYKNYVAYVHELQHAFRLCGIDKEIVI